MTTSKGRVVAVAIVALLGATPGWAQEGGQRADLADSLAQLAAILEGAGEQETPEEETSYGHQIRLLELAVVEMEKVAGEDWDDYMTAARHYDTWESVFSKSHPVEFAFFKVASRDINFMVLHTVILELWQGRRPRPDGEPCAILASCREPE